MLTKQEVRAAANRWGWIFLRSQFIGAIVGFTYLLSADAYFQPVPRTTQSMLIAAPMLLIYVVSFAIGLWKASRIITLCPACGKNLGGNALGVRLTRRCTFCQEKIVEGKVVTDEVLKRRSRLQRYKHRWLVWVALWFFPAVSGLVVFSNLRHLVHGSLILYWETDRKLDLYAMIFALLGILASFSTLRQKMGWMGISVLGISAVNLAVSLWHFFYLSSPPW